MEDQSIFGIEKKVDKKLEAVETNAIVERVANPVEIKQLVVSPAPMRYVALGEVKDIVDIAKRKQQQIDVIVWNEKEIKLVLKEGSNQISFIPEFHSSCKMFFDKENKRESNFFGGDSGMRIWEGEFEPVQFGKSDLIKFLKKYAVYFEPEVETAIKNMKITERKIEDSEMLSLDDDDNVRTVTEEVKTTNIPRQFKAMIPLFGGFSVELDFEACVTKKTDRYGDTKNKNIIELRCTNARDAVRQVMQEIISQFPEKIPKYYGKTAIKTGEHRSDWF